jgi:geranylgeranyl diphosphate synthase, type I
VRLGTMSSSLYGSVPRAARYGRWMRDVAVFEQFVTRVRAHVDALLESCLDRRVENARTRGAEVGSVADAVRALVLRGGKRMRAVLLVAAYEACGGKGGVEAVGPAAAALEFLQAYLLAHDDWMDGDDLRRGGPSVPAMMRERFGTLGDAASVLAGDLAAAWALESMFELELPPERVVVAARELGRVEEDVVHGQLLDVCATAKDAYSVEAAYALKTASYTVRSPIVMGASLAGASEAQVLALTAFAEPLGVAFQLRDDLLGTFGDETATGKPAGGDLRRGKRTVLVVEAMQDPQTRACLEGVLGDRDAPDDAIASVVARLEASGARARVEARIGALVRQSQSSLDNARLTPYGAALLGQAVVVLTQRDR